MISSGIQDYTLHMLGIIMDYHHPRTGKSCKPASIMLAAHPWPRSSGDNSRSAVKSGVVPVRINNRPTFLGAFFELTEMEKWGGGFKLKWVKHGKTHLILQDPVVFLISSSCRNQWFNWVPRVSVSPFLDSQMSQILRGHV